MAPPRRQTFLNLNEPTFDAFVEFAATAYPEQPLSFAIREACLSYIATDPLDATRSAARQAAWLYTRAQINETMRRVLQEAAESFAQVAAASRSQLADLLTTDPNALGVFAG